MKQHLNSISVNNIEIKYLIKRKDIKNIYFRFKKDKILYVTCNYLISDKNISKLLIENKESLIKMYHKINVKNQDIYYLGQKLNLINSEKIWLDEFDIYAPSIEQAKNYIYSLALAILQKRLNNIMILFNDLPEFTLKTRHMTSRWGVCNKKSMTITLNKELITKNINLIDYVIIHELCHFKYMNHSAAYWEYVSKFYPYYKRARKELHY